MVLNGVGLACAMAMGGVYTTVSLDLGKTPFSTVMVLERIADLADDAAEEERLIALAKAKPALTPASQVEPRLRDHILRDSGPSVMAAGGDWMLRIDWRASLAAGKIGDGADGDATRAGL